MQFDAYFHGNENGKYKVHSKSQDQTSNVEDFCSFWGQLGIPVMSETVVIGRL